MACGGVLAGRNSNSLPECAGRSRGWREMRERLDVSKAESDKIWKMQRARASDVAERVASYVAVIGGVGKLADADAIENDPEYSGK